MKNFVLFLLLLIATNSYAQKVIPFNSEYIDLLVRHMAMTDPIVTDEINETIRIKDWYADSEQELIVIYDVINSGTVDTMEDFSDFGMFVFECPMVHPSWIHVFLKYKNEIVIIEDDMEDTIFDGKGNGQHLIKQVGYLVRFFDEHQDVPRSYFAICTRRLIEIYELNRTILE